MGYCCIEPRQARLSGLKQTYHQIARSQRRGLGQYPRRVPANSPRDRYEDTFIPRVKGHVWGEGAAWKGISCLNLILTDV